MELLLVEIKAWLVTAGPWIVFLVTALETSVFIGLLIPAEATVLFAAFLAERGVFSLEGVLAATFFGALTGDQIGYFLGRWGGARLVRSEGRIGRLSRRSEEGARKLFARHAAMSVSVARFISFVRTLMPWFAGMSGMSYGRFLVFDLLGVAGWAGASVALGYLAGGSWTVVASTLGTFSAVVILVAVLFLGAWLWRRRNVAMEIVVEPVPVEGDAEE